MHDCSKEVLERIYISRRFKSDTKRLEKSVLCAERTIKRQNEPFECDKDKARANYGKHGVKITDAGRAFNSEYSLTGRSSQSDELNEERNLSILKLADGRAIVVVWTPRKENVRIISVRHARKNEKEALNAYLQSLQ